MSNRDSCSVGTHGNCLDHTLQFDSSHLSNEGQNPHPPHAMAVWMKSGNRRIVCYKQIMLDVL